MRYIVLETFGDAEDGNRTYAPGDFYPTGGIEPSEERIEELSTDKNRRGRPVIKAMDEVAVEEPKEEPKEEPTEEIVEEPKEEPKEEPTEEIVEEPKEEPKEETKPKKRTKKG